MKSFILCFFVLATLVVSIHSFTDDYTWEALVILKGCVEASKVTEKEVRDFFLQHKISNSPEMKKYLGCVAGLRGFVLVNGQVNKELLLWKLIMTQYNSKLDKIIQACAVKKSSKVETGYNLLKCVAESFVEVNHHPTV